MILATHDPEVMSFALFHCWRQVRLEAGAVVRNADLHEPAEKSGRVIALEAAMLRRLLEPT